MREIEMNKLVAHVNSVKEDTQAWAAATRNAAMASREEAERLVKAAEAKHAEATATLADAQAKADAINAKLADLKQRFAAGLMREGFWAEADRIIKSHRGSHPSYADYAEGKVVADARARREAANADVTVTAPASAGSP